MEKVWDDSNNQDGKRPTNVQVQLKSNGNNEGVTITLNSENNWKYTWENLPKYNNGKDFDIEMVFNMLEKNRYISDGNSNTIVVPDSYIDKVIETNKKIIKY